MKRHVSTSLPSLKGGTGSREEQVPNRGSFRGEIARIYKAPEKFVSRNKSRLEKEVVHRDFPKSQNNVPQHFLTSNSSQNPALDVSSD